MEGKSPMSKKSVAILAPTGMLGSMVYNVLKEKFNLILVYRNDQKLKKLHDKFGDIEKHTKIHFDLFDIYLDYLKGFHNLGPHLNKLIENIGNVDAVINCAGITKPNSLKDPLITLFINGCLPNVLSSLYKDRLIQITTDCVYDGVSGAPYNESTTKTPNDLYGLSKSIGEPKESMVLRTSIIGPEIDGCELLIEWLKKQDGKTISGFTNHLWNGITTKQFALICNEIIINKSKYPNSGIFHIYSTFLSKFDLLKKLKKKYRVKATILPKEAPVAVDRRLNSRLQLCNMLQIPSIDTMLDDL